MSTRGKLSLAAVAALVGVVLACSGCKEDGGFDFDFDPDDFDFDFEVLDPPTSLAASDGVYSDKVMVAWTASPKATSYEVWRNTAETAKGATRVAGSVRRTAYADTKATPGVLYYYWVRATSPTGSSQGGPWDAGHRAPRPTVQFAAAASSVDEGAGTVSLLVTLSSDVLPPPTVRYAVKGGTATRGGVDYTLVKGQLRFAPGETSKTLVVAITDDTLAEKDETVTIALSSPENAALGSPALHVLTIVDNDAPAAVAATAEKVHGQATNAAGVAADVESCGCSPGLAVSPGTCLDFGPVAVGELKGLQDAYQVRNRGDEAVSVRVCVAPPFFVALADGEPAQECLFDLAPGEAAKITIFYAPDEARTVAETLHFVSSDATDSRPLTGHGLPPSAF